MAEKITIRNNSSDGSLTSSDIGADGTIFQSPDQTNLFQQDLYLGVELVIDYRNMSYTGTGGPPEFNAIIEGKDNEGNYFPIAYQFNAFRFDDRDRFYTIALDPNINWFDAGVSNIVFIAGKGTIGEINPQQVTLPTDWRVCVHANEPTGTTLTSVEIDIAAELVSKEQ